MISERFDNEVMAMASRTTIEPNRHLVALVTAAVIAAVVLMGAPPASALGTYEQSFVLQPGWNAIFLEVAPVDSDIERAFAGVPVESVWAWNPPETRVDFVQDPADGLLDIPNWLHYVPPPLPASSLNNLFALLPNRAYLVELGGSEPVTWTVRGRPSMLPPIIWRTDSFNLLGFKVDPDLPPTFGSYFAPSPAHDGQPIYRLGTNGIWELVQQPDITQIQAGEAYWVFCQGASDYQGPLEVSVELAGRLEFGASLDQDTLVVTNASGLDTTIRVRRIDSVDAVPLAYLRRDEDTGVTSWPDLPSALSLDSTAGQEHLVDLGVRRADMTGIRMESILEISNDLGARLRMPVAVTAFDPDALEAVPALRPLSGDAQIQTRNTSFELAGLWVGEVRITGVSESQTGGTVPTPVGKEFPFRILIHVDGTGQARLLKEVIQLWQDGTEVPDPEDPEFLVVDEPGRYVLVTDENLIPELQGASLRDGVPVGYRISSAAYDFEGQWVELDGVFGLGGNLGWTQVLESEFPTNPFRHKFHPDHDNLDAQFLNFREEAYTVTREMELAFDAPGENEANPPGWGNTRIGGTFRESLSGLHKNAIFVEGTFTLTRLTATPVLNQ